MSDKKTTGWDNGLSQDYDAKLGTWFADRLGAKHQLRQDWSNTHLLKPTVEVPEPADPFTGQHQDDIDLTWWARIKQIWSKWI